MAIVQLSELQRAYRAQQRAKQRHDLRRYLIDRADPSSAAYRIVFPTPLLRWRNQRPCASEAERATLFSEIATAFLKV